MIQTITGIIRNTTDLRRYTRRNDSVDDKCIVHIVDADSDPVHPLEVAVTVTGEMARRWVGRINQRVRAEYAVRVFTFTRRDGATSLGNDIFGINLTEMP